MKKTDRAKYMRSPDSLNCQLAYADTPQPIGHNQTISAPHMHAYALELAEAAIQSIDRPRILDVGSGSGYLSACFGRMVESANGKVVGIELVEELANFARTNIEMSDKDLIDNGILTILCADGWKGIEEKAPFQFIHVGAAAKRLPQSLLDQLAIGGRMIIPLGAPSDVQFLTEVVRTKEGIQQRKLMSVAYVPLVEDS
uniref:protein-L-isoaspartate(D-aspartate) O-methyltransferase n=1 Tax=Albugo laibachii Nc14 TaxID=890382 RepID=F0W0D6_9STRA|nr:proteinLisoaspartate Omethyltransferase putative [Albugo laibachii Nc14]|eukprot:CCA14508.1 proteinLisoaspartate Omethyltransferase putative [Albugo laibachii Nc14]